MPMFPEAGNMLGVCGLAAGPWMQQSGDSAFTLFLVSRILGSTLYPPLRYPQILAPPGCCVACCVTFAASFQGFGFWV